MNRKLFTVGLGLTAALAVATASASATVIGGSSQSSQQGVNSTQGANAATATGDVIIVGPVAAGPTPTQTSINSEGNSQAVGSPGGDTAFISPTGTGPFQNNEQSVNSDQISSNGAIGLQISANLVGSSQIVGGDLSCVLVPTCDSSVIIGSPVQASQQGVNSNQSSDGGVTTGDSITTPTVILNGLAGSPTQFSLNALANGQLVLG